MDDFMKWVSDTRRSFAVKVSFGIVLAATIFSATVLIGVFPYSIAGLVPLCMLFLVKEYRKHKRGSEGG